MAESPTPALAGLPDHYRNIPAINLLPGGQRTVPRLQLGGRGQLLGRAVLVLVALVFALLYQVNTQQKEDSEGKTAEATIALSRLADRADRAEQLRLEIDALKVAADFPALDFAFLTERPAAPLEVVRSVFSTRVSGIDIQRVETLASGQVTVNLIADDHAAALEWRRQIIAGAGVTGVSRFDSTELQGVIVYDAQISTTAQISATVGGTP